MNPAHREAWPPAPGQQQTEQGQTQASRPLGSFGSSNTNQQSSTQASPAQGAGSVLPPPSATPFYSSSAATAHNQNNLPALSGLTAQPPQSSPHQSVQRPPSSESGPPQSLQGNPQQASSYSLPGLSQTLQAQSMQTSAQSSGDRERDLREREAREREIMESHAAQEDLIKREVEQRDRDLRDRQQHEQGALESHTGPIQIHQPVAVAPSARTLNGPNGLLGQPGPLGGPLGGPNPPAGAFGNAPAPQGDTTPRMQHAVQPPPPPSMVMPFGGPPGPMGMGQGQQPILNDALSYLDQVKVQFADHPDVYNRFLDIMKDFKSGAIDTPGVIERVSTLFAGHPNLIQGFNTFLPPGYKIECGTNGDPNAIRVTTPMGTMVSTMPAPRPLSPPRSSAVNGNAAPPNDGTYYESTQNRHWPQQARSVPEAAEAMGMFSPNGRLLGQPNLGQPLFGPQQGPPGAPLSPEVANRGHPESTVSAAALAHQQEQRGVSQLQNAVSAATARSILSPGGDPVVALPGQGLNGVTQVPQAGGVAAEKRGPVEFNHAISYVNKIKNRFASQPDIYKQFLEILQTYQRESKPIQDVYAQVTTLFGAAPDLLEDFKQFLPESAAQHRAQQQQAARHAAEDAALLSNARGEPGYGQTQNQHQTPRADTSRLPPMGNFAPTPTANRDNKRKRGERQGAGGPAAAAMPSPMVPEVQTSNLRGGYGPASVNKRAKTNHAAKQPTVQEGPPVSPTLTPALPEPLPPTSLVNATQDELAFFDRAKKYMGNKNTMNEFLKLCNLHSQDLIDTALLRHRSQAFIGGNPELSSWFKRFLGELESQSNSRPRTVNSRVALSNCRSLGPSYRLLPMRERERQCSGRDELCRSVLNDEWASHPTWASEDSGFVAHRKNQFEEALHRIEEERHDYDFNIEACNRTIQQLEPLATQLLTMRPEDRPNFVLPPGLGGQSETIHKRVTYKIYGREKGAEVNAKLFERPWEVVPVLLHRMKSQVEGWKSAQREWEKVWRDQTQKMFWKSLDHQALSIKQLDKRQFQPKSLQNEIQVRYEEQKRQLEVQEVPQQDYQFFYRFHDFEVLCDVAGLIITHAENSNALDVAKVIPFVKEFVQLFFGIEEPFFEQNIQKFGRDSSINSGDDTPSPDHDASQLLNPKAKKSDLRRGVLDPRGKYRKDKEDSLASASRDTTPDVASGVEDEAAAESSNSNPRYEGVQFNWIEHSDGEARLNDVPIEHGSRYRRTVFNMYANQNLYVFFRMFQVLYERLLRLKENEALVRETVKRAQEPKPAHELKMIDKMPSDFFKDTSDSANYYQQILDLLQDQIVGDVDMTQIEETLRRYYLQIGWQMYSFDKLMSALGKSVLAVVSHDARDKTMDIYNLWKKDRENTYTTHETELQYRKSVEKLIRDADTYRIAFDDDEDEVRIRLFKKDDPTFDFNSLDRARQWRAYVAAYTAVEPTERIDLNKVSIPFLKHHLAAAETDDADRTTQLIKEKSKLVITITPANYRMKFTATEPAGTGGVDYLVQKDAVRAGLVDGVVQPEEEYEALKAARKEKVVERLVRNNGWMKGVSREDVEKRKEGWKKAVEEGPVEGVVDGDVEMEG